MSRTIRIGMIGAGRIAEWHLKAWRAIRGVEIASIFSRGSDRADALASRFGIPMRAANLDQLLAMPDLDAVDICSPAETHAAFVIEAVLRGLHVYCEKPLGVSSNEIREIIRANAAPRRTIFNGFNLRFWPEHLRCAEIVSGGDLGSVRHASITKNSLYNARNDSRAHILFELSVHYIDLLRMWGFGDPLRTTARGSSILGVHHPDTVTLDFDFADGSRAMINNSLAIPGMAPEITIAGTKGVLHIREGKVIVEELTRRGGAGALFAEWRRACVTPIRLVRNPFQGSCAHFISCIQEKRATSSGPEEALRVIGTAEECVEALQRF